MVQQMHEVNDAQSGQRAQGPMPSVYRTIRQRIEDEGQAILGFASGADESLQMKEKDIQKQIRDYLNAKGIFNVRYNTGMAIAEYKGKRRAIRYHDLGPGAADIQALIPGSTEGEFRVLWIETKSSKGQQTMAQMWFEQLVKGRRMDYVVARSIDDLKDYIS